MPAPGTHICLPPSSSSRGCPPARGPSARRLCTGKSWSPCLFHPPPHLQGFPEKIPASFPLSVKQEYEYLPRLPPRLRGWMGLLWVHLWAGSPANWSPGPPAGLNWPHPRKALTWVPSWPGEGLFRASEALGVEGSAHSRPAPSEQRGPACCFPGQAQSMWGWAGYWGLGPCPGLDTLLCLSDSHPSHPLLHSS